MAKTNSKVGRSYAPGTIHGDIRISQITMRSQDIGKWKRAIDSARSVTNPNRTMLYELYENIMLDGHLESVLEKRVMGITNKEIAFYPKGKDGVVDEKVMEFVVKTPWFFEMLKAIMETVAWGHSLIELVPSKDEFMIERPEVINRANVIPETGLLLFDQSNRESGIYFREDKKYSNYLIEVGKRKDYGKLMTAAQYVIYKRGGFGDWAQFAELFGMPFRVGKYDPFDDDSRRKLNQALEEMGAAAHVVIPDGTAIEFHDNNSSGKSEIYHELIKECNSEISKIFVGQTMTTEDGSSHSQSKVHKEVEEDINLADMIRVEYLLNWEIKDKLIALGLPIPDGHFVFPQTQVIPLEKRILIDTQVAQQVPVADRYWYETYGIEKPTGKEGKASTKPKENKDGPGGDNPPDDDDEGGPANVLKHECCGHDYRVPVNEATDYGLSQNEERILKSIFEGQGPKYDAENYLKNINELKDALHNQLKPSVGYDEEDYLTGVMMELNINRFGYDKSLAEIIELNRALNPDETYSQFKKKATSILANYNKHWLRTEYDTAIATAQNAAAWNVFKGDRNHPYLQYKTVGDRNVRDTHRALDGMVFSVADPSWRSIYPPNGFNCRCEMIQLRADQVNRGDVKNGDDAVKALGNDWDKMQKLGFDKNAGDKGEIFDLNKGYLERLGEAKTDPNTLNFKDAGRSSYTEMKGLKKLKPGKAGAEGVLEYFDKNKVKSERLNRDIIQFESLKSRKVAVTRKALENHLSGHYLNASEMRDRLFWNLEDLFAKPDEIWLQTRGNDAQYRYVKYFSEGKVLVSDVDVSPDSGMTMRNWYLMKDAEANIRKGIPIK